MKNLTFDCWWVSVGCLEFIHLGEWALASFIGGAQSESVRFVLVQLGNLVRNSGAVVNDVESEKRNKSDVSLGAHIEVNSKKRKGFTQGTMRARVRAHAHERTRPPPFLT